jgi:hypothetical protein
MDIQDTTWARPDKQIDKRAMHVYVGFLKKFSATGEMFAFVLGAGLVALLAYAIFKINFENDIIVDGTARTCIWDGAKGKVVDGTEK